MNQHVYHSVYIIYGTWVFSFQGSTILTSINTKFKNQIFVCLYLVYDNPMILLYTKKFKFKNTFTYPHLVRTRRLPIKKYII